MNTILHTQSEPVIILGHARSGTSILGDLLRKYFQISFGPESQFLIRFHKKVPKYGELAQEKNLARLLRDILQERCFERWRNKFGYTLDEDHIFESIEEPSYKGVVYAVFRHLAQCGGMQRWGDKTPIYSWHLDVIRELFPNSPYIHIVRDGRDVALSSFNIHFGAKNVYKVAQRWTEELEKVQEFQKSIPSDQFLEMRYEDLMQEPVKELSRLIPFLGIQDEGSVLQQTLQSHVGQDLKKSNYDKWKTAMPDKDIFLFESIAQKWLYGYGYEVYHDGSLPRSVSTARRWYWEIQNHVLKLNSKENLKDSWYKLKIRINDVKNK